MDTNGMDTNDIDTTTAPSPRTGRARARSALTIASAAAVAAGGLLHLRVWDSDYREIPDGAVPGLWVVKVGFPLNAAASLLIAAALVGLAFGVLHVIRTPVIAAALALQAGSIAALVASRGPGIFGWSETGYEGDTMLILVVEIVAVVLLVTTAALDRVQPGEKT